MDLKEKVVKQFQQHFGSRPSLLAQAPGRVNLIGEHTDYNDGFVLPMAIDRAIWIAARPRPDKVRIHSLDFGQTIEFALDDLQKTEAGWGEYVKGVAWALQEAGHQLAGWEGVMAGDVPLAAGLSSSAALELATARVFAALSDLPWDPAEMALIGQKAENQWVGVNCGIMDQLISAAGVKGHALLIDCRSLSTTPAPLPPGTAVVVLDTATQRGLLDSAYNERRAQCEAAAQSLGIPALRDIGPSELKQSGNELDPVIYRRARHIVTENARTLQAAGAMRIGDSTQLGRLMNLSHISLRDDFEVSSDALNAMVECAQLQASCFGARMTGGGFGGCAVALVEQETAADFALAVEKCYRAKTGREPQVFICQPAAGANVESVWEN